MKLTSIISLYFVASFLSIDLSLAQNKGFSFQANIKNPAGAPVNATDLTINAKIFSPNGCVLREEIFEKIKIENGYLALPITKGAPGGVDPGLSVQEIFNSSPVSLSGLTCFKTDGTSDKALTSYTPNPGDTRVLRISTWIGTENIVADFPLLAVPFAINSETLNGKTDSQFLQVNDAENTTQSNLESLLNRYTQLDALLNSFAGGSIASNVTGNANNVSGVVAITNGGTGANSAVEARDNLGIGTLATVNLPDPLNSSVMLKGDGTWGPITSGGSLNDELLGLSALGTNGYIRRNSEGSYSTTNASPFAGSDSLVQRDGSGVSSFYGVGLSDSIGGNLTLRASAISDTYALTLPPGQGAPNQTLVNDGFGSLTWATAALAPASACLPTETVTFDGDKLVCAPSSGGSGGVSSVQGLTLTGNSSGEVTLQSSNISNTYTLTFPEVPGAANQTLKNDGAGNLSWTTLASAPPVACDPGNVLTFDGTEFICVPDQVGASGGGISSLNGSTVSSQSFGIGTAGTTPAWSSSSGVHTLNIPMASATGVTAGLISKSQYDTFTGKLGTTTALGGDVSGTYNAVTVNKIKGQAVTLTSSTSGQFLKYNGTAWVNSALSAADIPNQDASKITTGTLPIARGGTNSSTALVNNRIMASSGGAIVEAPAIAASRALISNASGIPTHSSVTSTELGYLDGVTSSVQTQLNSKLPAAGGTITGNLVVNGQVTIIGGTPGAGKVLTSNSSGVASWQEPPSAVPPGTLCGTRMVSCGYNNRYYDRVYYEGSWNLSAYVVSDSAPCNGITLTTTCSTTNATLPTCPTGYSGKRLPITVLGSDMIVWQLTCVKN
ncbi:hypothetical protein [Bdellovibrio sp.]|uniref:hypothetical protein n=1 Tax=Bdellovibrio sp. TaxID=28201 RepID=UPI0039E56521